MGRIRASTDATITANENRILDLKARMKNTGSSIDTEYAKKNYILEQKK
jgi:hypothetical protein